MFCSGSHPKTLCSALAQLISYHSYEEDTELILYFSWAETQVEAQVSACLTHISQQTQSTRLSCSSFQGRYLSSMNSPSVLNNSVGPATQMARNLGLRLVSSLTTHSCKFLFTTSGGHVRSLGLALEYCNSLLAGLYACVVCPLQVIQNAAAHLVFNLLIKFSHTKPYKYIYTVYIYTYHGLGEYSILIGCRACINSWYMDTC